MNTLLKTVRSSISLHTFKLNSACSIHSRPCDIFLTAFKMKNLKVTPTKIVSRSLSYFIHPEKMKQIVKGRDAHAICNYIASENYKRKVQEIMEMKMRSVFEELPEGVSPKYIKFEHIINCAQPRHTHKKRVKCDSDEEVTEIPVPKKRKKIKTTIMSVMLKRKNADNNVSCKPENAVRSIIMEQTKKSIENKQRLRKRTTILPIFFKKIQDRTTNEKYESEKHPFVNIQSEMKGGNTQIIPAEETNMIGYGNTNFHSSFGNNKEIFELFKRSHKTPTKQLSRNKSDAKPIKSARTKIRYSRRRPRGKKHVTMSLTSQMNLPINGQFPTDDNLTSNEVKKYHYSTKLNEPIAVSRVFDSYKLEKKCEPVKTKTGSYHEIAPTQKHLIRLPTLTPEGYRVMLYSVRDPDPTKLNFSDAIKVFCMYNDCVLSEDELKEGYVVLFDMKDVQLGHLARVSLPALRCFMMYIQEAHPVRLKAVHVLNTASWIHHVMRLIIPLVKSEILNLVKFHRGNTPEKFPIEILPKEYGGNVASMDELDQETVALLKKYEAWMLESSQLMSDESKRPRKASWWGLWTGSSKSSTNVELDEKTILKNLQID